jgi:hypothetical protein
MGETTVKTYLEHHPHKGFSGQPHYYPVGDYLTFYASEGRCFAMRVNELLTVYVSANDDCLVGCKVKGVARVMEQLKAMHVAVSDGSISLGLIFVSVAAITEDESSRKKVLDYAKSFPEAKIPKEVLKMAA